MLLLTLAKKSLS